MSDNKMEIKVECTKCGTELMWTWGQTTGKCPKCGKIGIRDTKLADSEVIKLFGQLYK